MPLRLLTCLAFIQMVFGINACKSRDQSGLSQTGITTSTDSSDFSSLFLSEARSEMGDSSFNKAQPFLVLRHNEGHFAPPSSTETSDFFQKLEAKMREGSPGEYLNASKDQPFNVGDAGTSVAALQSFRQKHGEPLTVILVGGIFGEFIEARPFEDLFVSKREKFPNKNKRAPDFSAFVSARSIGQVPVKTADGRQKTLDDLVSVSSIDDAEGKALVNVIYLNTLLFSGESLGSIESRAQIFTQRLNALFKKLEWVPKNIAIAGYSRGTMVSLEMLSQAMSDPRGNPWFDSVRAMVSLGGVVYGSVMSDATQDRSNLTAKQLDAATKFKNSLDQGDQWATMSFAARTSLIAKNTKAWTDFLIQMIRLSVPKDSEQSILEKVANAKNSIGKFARVDPRSSTGMIAKIWSFYNLSSPLGDQYPVNVKHFKQILTDLVTAVPELSERDQLKWWSEHLVPTKGIKYYSIAATMGQEAEFLQNPVGDIPGSLDEGILMDSYKQLVTMTKTTNSVGFRLNDSQVPVHRARFWSEIHPLLNPAQEKLDVTFLGLVGTSHWGIALEAANPESSGKLHPFPRRAMFKAMAAKIAMDQAQ